jgi:hypothetical protein
MKLDSRALVPRRSFFSRFGLAVTAAGAVFGSRAVSPAAQSSQPAPDPLWRPARHAQDDWLDHLPGKHRLFFDTTTHDELSDAIRFAGNFFTGNKNGYALAEADLAVVICLRHQSAPFAFTDAIWAKYGATLAARAKYTDPKSSQPPVSNPFAIPASDSDEPRGFASLAKRGVRFAVCNLSTHAIAGLIAQKTGGKADDAYNEITAALIPNGRLVPAGIVAVNRAQEHGYSLA